MEGNFFPTRALFWSFWANIIAIFGMTGYLLMDTLDYTGRNAFAPFWSSIIYVFLALLFVIDAIFQLCRVYNLGTHANRYYVTICSAIFDLIGSNAYLFGALSAATAWVNLHTIWTFNTAGVVGFTVGAILNMWTNTPTRLYSWANILNLIAALLYLASAFITLSPVTQWILITGDFIYVLDSVLYLICWFSDREAALP